jgi:ATP-dependent DNA helicase RecQ
VTGTGKELVGSDKFRRHLEISTRESPDKLFLSFKFKMNVKEFEEALTAALQHFPEVKLKQEQKTCLKILTVERKDVLGVLPTGYGKSLIYQLLPKLFSSYWYSKTNEKKTCTVIVVSPLELIRKQQVERLRSKGICAATIEDLKSEDDHKDKEIIFGSAECWLSDNWRKQLISGSLKNAEFLVVDEVHTVETW